MQTFLIYFHDMRTINVRRIWLELFTKPAIARYSFGARLYSRAFSTVYSAITSKYKLWVISLIVCRWSGCWDLKNLAQFLLVHFEIMELIRFFGHGSIKRWAMYSVCCLLLWVLRWFAFENGYYNLPLPSLIIRLLSAAVCWISTGCFSLSLSFFEICPPHLQNVWKLLKFPINKICTNYIV